MSQISLLYVLRIRKETANVPSFKFAVSDVSIFAEFFGPFVSIPTLVHSTQTSGDLRCYAAASLKCFNKGLFSMFLRSQCKKK